MEKDGIVGEKILCRKTGMKNSGPTVNRKNWNSQWKDIRSENCENS